MIYMMHSLTLTLPENSFTLLQHQADSLKLSPETVIKLWVEEKLKENNPLPTDALQSADPLEQFIGRFQTGLGDIAARHDHYLGVAIASTNQGDTPTNG